MSQVSHVVYKGRGVSLASGLSWQVLSTTKGGNRSAIRKKVSGTRATRYVLTEHADSTYIGAYTPDVLDRSAKGEIHSLALVFLNALLAAHRDTDRGMLNAALSISVDTDHSKRALVVIADGNIVSDTVEQTTRVHEAITDWRAQFSDAFEVYSGDGDIHDAVSVSWDDLLRFASNKSQTLPLPRSMAIPAALAGVLLIAAGAVSYHYLVTVPAEKAERARKAAEADHTSQYLKQLHLAMETVGWSVEGMATDLHARRDQPFFTSGWALKSVECKATGKSCVEQWDRVGGKLPALVAARTGAAYMAQTTARDGEAMFSMPVDISATKLTMDMLPVDAKDADFRLRPSINELVNAGARVQVSEPMSWPPVPLQGVKADAVVKRRKVVITVDYAMADQALKKLPAHVVPESYVISTSTPFEASITAYAYVK